MPNDRLIEHSIPYLKELDQEAQKEKLGSAKPPVFELTFWWTRKPLSVSRAVILASIVPKDFNENLFKEVLGLNMEKRAHNYNPKPNHIKQIKEIIQRDWGGQVVLVDPFAGAGSIPLEALRLGVSTIAIEYNPVAWLLLKVIEWTKKYGEKLANPKEIENARKRYRRGFTFDTEKLCKEPEENLRRYGDIVYYGCKILNKLKNELSQFYPDHNGKRVSAYIWLRQVKCPKCGAWVPLTLNWYLNEKKNVYFVPVYNRDNYTIEIKNQGKPPQTTMVKGEGEAVCPRCGYRISNEYIVKNVKGNDRLAVLVLEDGDYAVARDADVNALNNAREYLNQRDDLRQLIPNEEISPKEIRPTKYGFTAFSDLFNDRQLLIHTSLVKAIRDARNEMLKGGLDRDYVDALTGILSLLITKHVDFNSAITTWDSGMRSIRDVFAFRRPSMTWQYAEANPFALGSGTLWNIFSDLIDGIAYLVDKLKGTNANITVVLGSALHMEDEHGKPLPDKSVKIIITDPPYFDDVPYAELSDFFYVWLKRVLGDVFPNAFSFYTLWHDRTDEEVSVGGSRDEVVFRARFIAAMREIRRVLSDDGLLVLFFAHSSVEAWRSVLEALLNAGFWVVATHPVKTESPGSVVAKGKLSIESSIVIVARPRLGGGRGYIEDLYGDVTKEVKSAIEDSWGAGYRGADLVVSAFGAALKVVTKYSEIKSRSSRNVDIDVIESLLDYVYDLTPRTVIELIFRLIFNKPDKSVDTVDPYTAFYIYAYSVPEYYSSKGGKIVVGADELLKLTKSLGIRDVSDLVRRGLVRSLGGRGRKSFELLMFKDRKFESTTFDSVIDALHYLLQRFEEGGAGSVQVALQSIKFVGFAFDDICSIAYGLVMSGVSNDETKVLKQFLDSVCGRGVGVKGSMDLFL